MTTESLNLADLKAKSPKDLLAMAEELEIENASTMRKGEMMFQILRERADEGWEISGDGVLEVVETAKAIRISSWAITFLAAVVAWVFFRATTTSGAITMTLSMFGSVADGAAHMPASPQTILWGTLAAISAFLLPNTKEISALFEKDLLKRSSALIGALGITSGVAASAAFLASLSLTQSPFLYFNF